jgi:para-nitrobenzyl esterase
MDRVLTQYGWLEGETRAAHQVFRGIPFAKPPVGTLRMRAPVPPEPWTGVREARAFGPSSLQTTALLSIINVPRPVSEDCLYLNVYTPRADTGSRPVFVWIHGGAFVVGSGGEALYDGGALAERGDMVVVTINYRLGALGFCHWSDSERARLDVRSNVGCLDQIAALEWVRDNIAAFGGDPEQVTIAGESAGAFSVAMLLAMPAAKGLFKRAITQSGARLSRVAGDPARATHELLRALDIAPAQVDTLWQLSAEQVLEAQQRVAAGSGGAMGGARTFCPVFDGDTLPYSLDESFARGLCAGVPLLIGCNRDELNLFLGAELKKLHKPIDDAALTQQLRSLVPEAGVEQVWELLEVYRQSRSSRQLPASERALLAAISSDALWRIPSMRFAEAHLRSEPRTYQYLFTYGSPAMRGALGSCHALELGFVFSTLDSPGQAEFAGSGEAQQRLSARMMDSWIAFTRSGDPSVPGPNQDWPAYDLERRPTMVFDLESGLQHDPFGEERAAWDKLTPRPLQ